MGRKCLCGKLFCRALRFFFPSMLASELRQMSFCFHLYGREKRKRNRGIEKQKPCYVKNSTAFPFMSTEQAQVTFLMWLPTQSWNTSWNSPLSLAYFLSHTWFDHVIYCRCRVSSTFSFALRYVIGIILVCFVKKDC